MGKEAIVNTEKAQRQLGTKQYIIQCKTFNFEYKYSLKVKGKIKK